MSKMNRFGLGLVALAIFQTFFLGWMIAGRVSLLSSATVVRLATEPVDPRDIFRGDYVTLNYEISRLKVAELGAPDDLASGDKVFVTLAPTNEIWQAVALSRTRPDAIQGKAIIRGRIIYVDRSAPPAGPNGNKSQQPCPRCGEATIHYGIESYFVPEGTGHDLEAARNERRIMVDVAISDDGEAAIKSLNLDGRPLYTEPLF